MKTLLVAGLIGLMANGALAHSPLRVTKPADTAVVTEAPAEILMEFNGSIRLTRVTVVLVAGDSVDIDLGNRTAFAKTFSLPLNDMGAGTYQIAWRGLSEDGHAMNGSFRFTVKD